MAFRLTPPVFRREVERRLMDVRDVMEHINVINRQSVWKRVRAGTLPPPIVNVNRSHALWDRDEIEKHIPTPKETP